MTIEYDRTTDTLTLVLRRGACRLETAAIESEGDERTCQATIGTATYEFAKALGGAARKCADKAGKVLTAG